MNCPCYETAPDELWLGIFETLVTNNPIDRVPLRSPVTLSPGGQRQKGCTGFRDEYIDLHKTFARMSKMMFIQIIISGGPHETVPHSAQHDLGRCAGFGLVPYQIPG
jgi:hypothetical protein